MVTRRGSPHPSCGNVLADITFATVDLWSAALPPVNGRRLRNRTIAARRPPPVHGRRIRRLGGPAAWPQLEEGSFPFLLAREERSRFLQALDEAIVGLERG